MEICFTDESGSLSDFYSKNGKSEVVVYASVMSSDTIVPHLEEKVARHLDEIKESVWKHIQAASFGSLAKKDEIKIEFHTSEIVGHGGKKKKKKKLKPHDVKWWEVDPQVRAKIFYEFYKLIGSLNVTINAVGIRKSVLDIIWSQYKLPLSSNDQDVERDKKSKKKKSEERAMRERVLRGLRKEVFKMLLERISYSTDPRRLNAPTILVVFDGRFWKKDQTLFYDLDEVRRELLSTGRLTRKMFLSLHDSMDEPLIQVADAIAYLLRRLEEDMTTVDFVNPQTNEKVSLDILDIFNKFIEPKIREHWRSGTKCDHGYHFLPREESKILGLWGCAKAKLWRSRSKQG